MTAEREPCAFCGDQHWTKLTSWLAGWSASSVGRGARLRRRWRPPRPGRQRSKRGLPRAYRGSKHCALARRSSHRGLRVADAASTEKPDLPQGPKTDTDGQPSESAPDEGGADDALSVAELRFVDMMAAGENLEAIAKVLKVTSRTLRRWRKRPEVAAAIRNRLTENVSVARAILSAGAAKAAGGLVAQASGEEPAMSARVSACLGVLGTTLKLTEIEDLQAELAAIREQLAALPGGKFRRM